MNRLASSHYEIVATAFQVSDIAQPLRTFVPPDWTVADALMNISEDQAEDPDNWICLIRDEAEIIGYIALDDDTPGEERAAEGCTPITPDQIVPGSMPLLDLVPLFRQRYFFFVLTRNDVTHVVSYVDLDKLPVRLCLFSLITALESEMLGLFTDSSGRAELFLKRLPENRLRKAREVARMKYEKEIKEWEGLGFLGEISITAKRILTCTTFNDKALLALNSPKIVKMLPFHDQELAEQFFNRAYRLRNQIAHSDSVILVLDSPQEFDDFTTKLRRVTEAVSILRNELKQTL